MTVFATCEHHGLPLGACPQCWDEERTRLEKRLVEVTKERDAATQIADACCKPAMEGLVQAEARLATLDAALRKYGRHVERCAWGEMDKDGNPTLACTCGFATTLEGRDDGKA